MNPITGSSAESPRPTRPETTVSSSNQASATPEQQNTTSPDVTATSSIDEVPATTPIQLDENGMVGPDTKDEIGQKRLAAMPAPAPSSSASKKTAAAAATPSGTTSGSDPRYVCDADPNKPKLGTNQFMARIPYYGYIEIDPGTTGKSYDELYNAFGRAYSYSGSSVRIGDGGTGGYTSKYSFRGTTSPMSTSFVSMRICYVNIAWKQWGQDLVSSDWVANKDSSGKNLNWYDGGYIAPTVSGTSRYVQIAQVIFKINPTTTSTTTTPTTVAPSAK